MKKAYIITGPTSGIGYYTARELAKHGTLILVGRDRQKLDALKTELGDGIPVVCDLSNLASVRRAADEIIALKLPIAGIVNNAGIFPTSPQKNAQGIDNTYATNHLGPFAFTAALIPHLASGTNVLFVASAVEDPERKLANLAGFRGARFISVAASARGEWSPGGSANGGFDAYATSKQGNLLTARAFARQYPHLRFNAIEPGFSPGSNLGRHANFFARFVSKYVLSPLAPFIKYWSTPKIAGRVITKVVTSESGTGIYYDERGEPMPGSVQSRDTAFQDRVVAETRAFLSTVRT